MLKRILGYFYYLKLRKNNKIKVNYKFRMGGGNLNFASKNDLSLINTTIKKSFISGNSNNILKFDFCKISHSQIEMENNCKIILGKDVELKNCCFKIGNNSIIEIGDNVKLNNTIIGINEENKVSIGAYTEVGGMKLRGIGKNNYIKIGENCLISTDVNIRNTDSHKIYKNGMRRNEDKPVEIKDNVWIGEKVTILKGVIIESGSVIGNRALVTKNLLNKNSIYAGVPAKCIEKDIVWEK